MISDGLPILELRRAMDERFQSTRSKRLPRPPLRDRAMHAALVLDQIDGVTAEIAAIRNRTQRPTSPVPVTAEGQNLDDATVMNQLAPKSSGNELLTSDDGIVVFRPGDDLSNLRMKTESYLAENTPKGNPKYNSLIARIDSIRVANIADLSSGEISAEIPDDARLWVEIWTLGQAVISPTEHSNIQSAILAFADLDSAGLEAIPVYRGQERDIYVIFVSGEALKALPELLPEAVEVHLAPNVFPIVLAEAQDNAGEIAEVELPPEDSPAVAIHDSGIDISHPYVSPVLLGAESVVPGEPATFDKDGHGTQMAGVGIYSSLAADVANGFLKPDSWLVSVRLLESAKDSGGDPERGAMWAERTRESILIAETIATGRTVVHNMSIGAENPTIGSKDRTAWSIATDLLAWNNGIGRLIVVATGNADRITERSDYPFTNLGPPFLQQPGQAWNALTVGGYTNLDQLTPEDVELQYPAPLAQSGQLSPHTRTSRVANRPIKPDIVMEAGNTAPDGHLENPEAQGLSILTLQSSAHGSSSLLRRTAKTSPAAAAASNALARIARSQPGRRPATWRALLVNTARWPVAATQQLTDRRDLLRTFGYGVPQPERASSSSSNRPVMIYEGSLRPSARLKSEADRRVDFIELPLPDTELQELGGTLVELTVTLSYFIEPTESSTRGTYAGGRLRWDLQGPTETPDGFRARINKIVRKQGVPQGGGSFRWEPSVEDRSRGTLQQGKTIVDATMLAGRRLIAVYPVVGWWEDSVAGRAKELPYSLAVSVDLGEADIDIYVLTAAALVPASPIPAN